jgi:capsular exopolysaccharide synthesis family protein
MLHRQTKPKPRTRGELEHAVFEPEYIRFSDISAFFRRYFLTVTSCLITGAALAIFYVMTTMPLYTAYTQILIDTKTSEILDNRRTEMTLDAAAIESQIALLTSDTIVRAVVEGLNLKDDPEFVGESKPFFSGLLTIFSTSGREETPIDMVAEDTRTRLAVEALRNVLDVRRLGLSYVINLSVTAANAEKAARLANAMAESYEREQIVARTRAARQSSEWLETRIYLLGTKLNDAARDLQNARTGRGFSASKTDPNVPKPDTVEVVQATVDAYRQIYQSYFQALTNAVEQQSFQGSNSRIITPAAVPVDRSHPRSKLILILGIFAGMLVGISIALIRKNMDNSVRSAKQIRNGIGLECLARIPRVTPAFSLQKAIRKIATRDAVAQRLDLFNHVIKTPFSQFAGAITALKTAIMKVGRQDGIQTLGITSALPNEGKSTTSANLAAAFVLSSHRTLIVDADIHRSMATQTLAPGSRYGLFEVLKGERTASECIVFGQGARPDILPVVLDEQTPDSYTLLNSDQMRDLLQQLKENYHYIIVDLPPLTPVAEGLTMSSMLDAVLLVVEWGRTPQDLVADVTYGLNLADANILGVALTKVDQASVHLGLKKALQYY